MEFVMQNLWQIWAVIAVVCLILELSSGDFFIMCFSIGAVVAAVSAVAGVDIYWQLGIFAVATLLSIFLVRPVALRYLHRGEENRVSNADALMGRHGKVSETIEAGGFGRVAIDGDVWKAVSQGDEAIPVGTTVCVVGRESTIITVRALNS